MKIDNEEWHELHPKKVSPPKNKKCMVLILREGYFSEKKSDDTYEFNADQKGPHKIIAWRETNE